MTGNSIIATVKIEMSQIDLFDTFYATQIENLKFSKSETESDVSTELASYFQLFVILLYLSVLGFSLPSNYTHLK
jgi:hypothetical protein